MSKILIKDLSYNYKTLLLSVKSLLLYDNMSIFIQSLNPITGIAMWEEKDEHYAYHQEVARSAFADMLHDHERNNKYYIALKRAIEKKHLAGEKANVLDIGTGTGLLSMMAAKCGADTITACEAFAPMAQCAIKIIEENGFKDKIKLVQKRSTKMTVGKNGDMPKRANILVTEVFDTELIGEGALSTFRHAHEILLEKNCIVVPTSGTIWAQVVESSAVCAWNRIKSIYDVDDKTLLIDAPASVKTCSGAAAVHDMQLSQFPTGAFTPLTPPQPIFRFDWSGKTPLINDEKVSLQVKPMLNGTAHAIFLWWDLNMDTDGEVLLSCAPVWEHPEAKKLCKKTQSFVELADKIPWRDHWMQAVYYFPTEASVNISNYMNLIGYHDEYSFWFQLQNMHLNEIPDYEKPVCSCYVHVSYSRTRIGQVNDQRRNRKYIQALRKKVTKDTTCVCFSDGSLLGLAAAKLGAKKVFILETNFLSRKTIEKFVHTNQLVDVVEIMDSLVNLPPSDSVDLIFGEPHFISSIVPWDNLRFWYLSSKYPSHIQRIPIAATIKGVVVEFKDLHKIRAPLGRCEGFDLSIFDKLIQASSIKSDSPVEAQPLWEYPAKALSASFILTKFDLSRNITECSDRSISNTVPILKNGSCNGVALWVDWQLDSDFTVSSGPTENIIPGQRIKWDPFTRQGVFLFRKISNVTLKNTISWCFSFNLETGCMEFEFDVK